MTLGSDKLAKLYICISINILTGDPMKRNTITLYVSDGDKAIYTTFQKKAKGDGVSTSEALVELMKEAIRVG